MWSSHELSLQTSDVKLNFENLTTVLTQIEPCLNSRPLTYWPTPDDDGIESPTPGHFLIGQPLESLPDSSFSYHSLSLLKQWDLCQSVVCHLDGLMSTFSQIKQQMVIFLHEIFKLMISLSSKTTMLSLPNGLSLEWYEFTPERMDLSVLLQWRQAQESMRDPQHCYFLRIETHKNIFNIWTYSSMCMC